MQYVFLGDIFFCHMPLPVSHTSWRFVRPSCRRGLLTLFSVFQKPSTADRRVMSDIIIILIIVIAVAHLFFYLEAD